MGWPTGGRPVSNGVQGSELPGDDRLSRKSNIAPCSGPDDSKHFIQCRKIRENAVSEHVSGISKGVEDV